MGFFDKLKSGLQKTRDSMMGKVTQVGRMLNEVFLDYLKANYPVK